MPLTIPTIADRNYQQLLDESLARIPVHNPEWTNFNKSDPGVTLIELFAFLTENLLYRSNQIPERNRRKFLSLLGVPLQPQAPARGLVAFTNELPDVKNVTLNDGMEVCAGKVPFRTAQGLDVLPIEARAYYKRRLENPPSELVEYYRQLYASYRDAPPFPATFQLYETTPFTPKSEIGIDLGREAVGGSLWIALMLRVSDKPADNSEQAREALKDRVRREIAGKTLSLGMAPVPGEAGRHLAPGDQSPPGDEPLWQFHIPVVPPGGSLPDNPAHRVPMYKTLDAVVPGNIQVEPGVVQITLPPAEELTLWKNLEPLEAGVGEFAPALEDAAAERVLTWLRVTPRAPGPTSAATKLQARLLWVGINAAAVTQRAHVANELLPEGTGEPDQLVVLAQRPVLPGTVRITVTDNGGEQAWSEIDDLFSAAPEVPAPDPRQPPGHGPTTSCCAKSDARRNHKEAPASSPPASSPPESATPSGPAQDPRARVFACNAEAGEVRFGDGAHGARPPRGAILRADYDFGLGRAGNVRAGSIDTGPALPPGIKVGNPLRTWGGAEAESVADGEKQIPRYLQHRDRLVNALDFETVALRTPGVDVGRVEVIPVFSPELGGNEPGDAPGAVTLMVIPAHDSAHPEAPVPDQLFLDTICAYLNPRRLVTTEVFLRGPAYKRIWVTVGIEVVAGYSIAVVREAVKKAVTAFLSPLPRAREDLLDVSAVLAAPQHAQRRRGWPLAKPVLDLELLAEVSRVPGVAFVNGVQIAQEGQGPEPRVVLRGLQLPWLVGIAVGVGAPPDVEELRGQRDPPAQPPLLPVPVVPEEC